MVGGGVSSEKNPLHSSQMTADEISATVEAAAAWDIYVGMHVYYDSDIRRAIDLGVKVVDHGQFISKKTMKDAKKRGVIFSFSVSGMDPRAFEWSLELGLARDL